MCKLEQCLEMVGKEEVSTKGEFAPEVGAVLAEFSYPSVFIDAVEDMPDGIGDDEEGECEFEGEVLEGCFD